MTMSGFTEVFKVNLQVERCRPGQLAVGTLAAVLGREVVNVEVIALLVELHRDSVGVIGVAEIESISRIVVES